MNARSVTALAILVALPLSAGCASRTAPFDKLDDAQMTILKLQGDQAAATQAQPTNPLGQLGIPIPGMTPEMMQQMMQQGQQQLQQLGLPALPGIPGLTQPQQTQPAAAKFNGYTILGQTYGDDDLKDEILDLYGDEDSFNMNRGQCFTPGMAVVFTPADGSPNVELMISLSCNQTVGNGFQWPYPANGFTPETANKLRNIYMRLWGTPPPPSGV